jgi:hypothetical protein
MNSSSYTLNTERLTGELADLNPKTLSIMHGSSFRGDGGKALRERAPIVKEILAGEECPGPVLHGGASSL